MKGLFPVFSRLSELFLRYGAFVIIFTVLLSFFGYHYFKKIYMREIRHNLESTTKLIWAVWNSVTIAHEETMNAIFELHIINEKTLEILRRANSSREEEVAIARAELFRHLGDTYEHLKKNYFIRQLHFHTPENRSFLRFHAPSLYGDDLTPSRPTVVLTNKLKRPHFSFETGRLITGYRYVFPIIDSQGNHLGSVELSRPFEAIRRYLAKIYPEAGYRLILRKKDVFPKLLEPFKKYYSDVPGLSGWVIEDPYGELPDSPPPLTPEQEEVLKKAIANPEFLDLVESKENVSTYVNLRGKIYKVSMLKLFELDKDYHSGVLIAISPGEDIALILQSQRNMTILYVSASSFLILAFIIYWSLANVIRRKTREFETIVEIMGGGLILIDKKGTITYVNDYGAKIFKTEKEELIGRKIDELFAREGEEEELSLTEIFRKGEAFSGDLEIKTHDGREVVVHIIARPIKIDATFEGILILFYDISERKKYEEELFKASITDCLTGLYNRRLAEEELERARVMSERYNLPFSVLLIDVDDFKKINDRYGHDVGDMVLKILATVLKHECREADIVARWGGEEFLIILLNTDYEGAGVLAERLRRAVESLKLSDIPKFTISIGYATYRNGEGLESLLKRVDTALYTAKRAGKNTCVGYSEPE